MTTGELIERLKEHPADTPIQVAGPDTSGYDWTFHSDADVREDKGAVWILGRESKIDADDCVDE